MGVNVEDAKVKTAAIKLGCLVLKTPFTYLGTKVGDNMSRKHAWNEVEEKVISRLSRWKMKTLSIGGRVLKRLFPRVYALELNKNISEVSLSTRWVKSVPIKVNILAWKVKSNALPTRFNISHRGIDIDSIDCPIYNMGVETTSHVLFQCKVVRQIMRKISSWWNMDYLEVDSYEDWRAWLVSTRIHSSLKGIIEGIYNRLWWVMWNFRNKLLFDTKTPEKALIFDNLYHFGQQAKPRYPKFTLDAVLQPVTELLLALPAAETIKSPATQVLEEASVVKNTTTATEGLSKSGKLGVESPSQIPEEKAKKPDAAYFKILIPNGKNQDKMPK
uniref:RNA-directed DNA polymerase, eukaryota n=1 Tax=Tanacetum cinerariifolium TaxID=118510 RepID=A0A699IGX5_TANCI|nr:RNA-directed DNA polymerase, eukaryota [Tanacetum cinerariifolium]